MSMEAIPAVFLGALRLVGAVEEFPFEQLHGDDSKYKLEQPVHYQDVDHVL